MQYRFNQLIFRLESYEQAVQIFNPWKATAAYKTICGGLPNRLATVLQDIPCLSSDEVDNLITEFPNMLAAFKDLKPADSPTIKEKDGEAFGQMWLKNKKKLPAWSAAYKKICLYKPASGESERAFSVLSNSVSAQQKGNCSEDLLFCKLHLRYRKAR